MNTCKTTSLALVMTLVFVGCGGSEPEETAMALAGAYALDRDALLRAYVEQEAEAWSDLEPAEREREKARLERGARLGFEALAFDLELAPDGTFVLSRTLRMAGQTARTARGTWRASGGGVTLQITHEDRLALGEPRGVLAREAEDGALQLTWDDTLPTLVLRRAGPSS